ncbi:hypothetical protein [Metallosphaera tengchongensis]|uniref:hypothetical protein n=1 Tax=Metallosphaera tengchongensis TaxID=1532350 RepID=UPI001FE43BCF|nr:hypothetical protein [Metallosphaera tengchongensis]
MWLTPVLPFSTNFNKMSLRVAGVGAIHIEGYPRDLSEYKDWEVMEARSALRDGKAYLKVTILKDWKWPKARDSVAVDIMAELVVGKGDEKYVKIPTRLEDAHHNKSLAESLQKYEKSGKRTGSYAG